MFCSNAPLHGNININSSLLYPKSISALTAHVLGQAASSSSSSSSSSHHSTAVYQIWGQVARDKFRYAVRPGCVLLVKNFSAKCVRLHRAADPGHEAACQSVAVEDGGGDGGDSHGHSHSHRGTSLLVQGGEFLILDDVTDGEDINQVRALRSGYVCLTRLQGVTNIMNNFP